MRADPQAKHKVLFKADVSKFTYRQMEIKMMLNISKQFSLLDNSGHCFENPDEKLLSNYNILSHHTILKY